MATLPSESTPNTDQMTSDPEANPQKKKWKIFKEGVDICKQYRQKLIPNWSYNVDFMRGKPFTSQSDDDRVATNLDWSLTLAKQAQLFSQVPMVFINHSPETTSDEAMPWVHSFQSRINDTLRVAGIEAAMDEVLVDCINAAGFGAVIVARETITRKVDVPSIDLSALPPVIQQQIMTSGTLPDGSPIPMETIDQPVDARYIVTRISPRDFLWPINFDGSDFDNAPWVGRSGQLSWAEAKGRFGLTDEDKSKVVGDDKQPNDKIVHDTERDKNQNDEVVQFDEIFYKDHYCNEDAQSFNAIHHLVFVHGKADPVIDEPWKGQEIDQQSGQLIGALRYPIRVLKLVYLTDEPIPPSDTAIGRAQVNELAKSRTQMMMQRERSLPIRTMNVNYVDPIIQHALMRGNVQHIIPVQGSGKVIEEVSRASHPPENYTFDKVIKGDLLESWRVGPEPGVDGPQVAEQSPMGSMRTRVGKDRAKVAKFFCSIAEVIGGLITLFEPAESFGQGYTPMVSRSLGYSILADSTVLLDSKQRITMLTDFLDISAKSNWIDVEYVLREIATLSGLDPAIAIKAPEPAKPPAPNISLRLTGTEDMLNPLTLAFMDVAGMMPSMEQIEKAKEAINFSLTPPASAMGGMPPTGGVPPAMPMQAGPGPGMVPPGPPNVPAPYTPTPMAPAAVGDGNPEWSKLPHLDKRKIEHGDGGEVV